MHKEGPFFWPFSVDCVVMPKERTPVLLEGSLISCALYSGAQERTPVLL